MCCAFSVCNFFPSDFQAQWVGEFLGPKIRNTEIFTETKIMIVDDQRVYYPWIPRYVWFFFFYKIVNTFQLILVTDSAKS